ncbi:hypothetical protein VC83_07515 [Pseudogymnoascus destructans]|uniref:Uncharacterized protein n=2 Tax=Pseudogymnoascus destructans TaxID=655981 RepID=L8G406_PSED2|nr:uncharacterized protein VC83_07515 [Pseudogymnoascus destructans]ELR07403.1 hypothetical protein GMDG_02538 [Pseudogymnoascus destructans 20631-21]OAF56085.1 hypothetical protein VC83_07515 [Pseudogymnoascus destructans]
MSTPPNGLPGRRGINPPAPIEPPPPGEQIAPGPLTTPSDESPRSSPNTPPDNSPPLPPPGRGGTRRSPITPPDNSPPLPPPGRGGTRSGPVTTPDNSPLLPPPGGGAGISRPITPPVHSPPPQVTPQEKGVRIGNVPFTMLDRKFGKKDQDLLQQQIDDLRCRGERPKPPKKGPYSHLPPSQIRHVKGRPGNIVMAADENFVVRLLEPPRHTDGPQSDEFFDHLFTEANKITTSFVVENFGGFNIKPDELEGKRPWNEMNVSPLFVSLAELVQDVDPDDAKSWDSLLYYERKRCMMIMGIIARIFVDKVFSPLLFGCTPNQATMLNALETDMAEKNSHDGFARTKTRSRAIREVLDGAVLPTDFYDEVELLSLNIFGLLNPISAYLEKYRIKHNLEVSIPTREEQFAALFDMVSGTAWLSICRRLHPDPIILRMSELGDEFKEDLHVCANYDEYCTNKAKILKLQYDRLGQEIKNGVLKQKSANVEELPATEILKDRTWLVKTAVWPSVNIYSPVYGDGADGQGGVADLSIQKCEVAAQWVVPRNNRASTSPSLREWAK